MYSLRLISHLVVSTRALVVLKHLLLVVEEAVRAEVVCKVCSIGGLAFEG